MTLEALVSEALAGGISVETARAVAALPDEELSFLLAASDRVRRHHFGTRVKLCSIVNARSNLCGEDCAFCAQSHRADADVPTYPLLDEGTLLERARAAREAGAGSSPSSPAARGRPPRSSTSSSGSCVRTRGCSAASPSGSWIGRV